VSTPDSFIEEVTEEVRRDRLYGWLRRYGWIAVLLVLLAVGGAAFNEWRKAQAQAAAQTFGDAVLAALDAGDPAARAAALSAVDPGTAGGDAGRRAVLALLRASEAQRAGDTAAALEIYAGMEAQADLPSSYRQMAALKRVMLGGSGIPAAERETTLAGLSAPDQPFRPLALEQIALLRIEAGERDAALEILRDLLDEPEATQGLRARAQQLIVALDGTPEAG
jgi:hypothetical protein